MKPKIKKQHFIISDFRINDGWKVVDTPAPRSLPEMTKETNIRDQFKAKGHLRCHDYSDGLQPKNAMASYK